MPKAYPDVTNKKDTNIELTYALADNAVVGVHHKSVCAAFRTLVERFAGFATADLATLLVRTVTVWAALAAVHEWRALRLVALAEFVAVGVFCVSMLALKKALI